jgi:hypothetical protein
MMFVDCQQEGRPVVGCLFGAGPVPEACSSFFGEIAPRPGGRLSSVVGAPKWARKRVCTLCTPWASDWVVPGSDRAGFRMFSGLPSVFKAWNTVRVPPRAQHDPSSEGFLL